MKGAVAARVMGATTAATTDNRACSRLALTKDFQSMRNQELSTFREVVMGITQKLAKEENYNLIMQADGVMYVDDSYNITSKILTRLKAELPKK